MFLSHTLSLAFNMCVSVCVCVVVCVSSCDSVCAYVCGYDLHDEHRVFVCVCLCFTCMIRRECL